MVNARFRRRLALLAAACALPMGLSTAYGANILFMVGDDSGGLSGADGAVRDYLQNIMGHTVTVIDDGINGDAASQTAMTAALPGKDLVIISSNVGSGNCVWSFGGTTALRDLNKPVIVYEDFVYDDMMITATPAFQNGQLSFDMTANGAIHPMGAGLSGNQVALTSDPSGSAMPGGDGGWGSGVQLMATFSSPEHGGNTLSPLQLYEKGASLFDGTPAPQRRATLFIHDRSFSHMTAVGQKLFDATINYMTPYTWAAGSSTWATNTNWAQFAHTPAAAPTGVGTHVEFLAGGAPTITLDGAQSAGILHFNNAASYTIAAGAGGSLALGDANHVAYVTVDSGSHSITAPLSLPARTIINTTTAGAAIALSGTMTVGAASGIEKYGTGTLSLNADTGSTGVFNASFAASGGTTNFGSTQHLTALTLTNAKAVITEGGSRIVVTNALTMTGATSTINIKDNDMLITAGTLSTIQTAVVTAKIFTNSVPPAGKLTAVGYAGGAEAAISGLGGVFDGQPFDAGSVLIKYTYVGDSNLDGSVDGSDVAIWAQNFSGALGVNPPNPRTWAAGDWNNDGSVDGSDVALWAQNFTGALGGGGLGDAAPGIAAVPEPATLGLLGIGAMSLLARRRRA